MFDLEEATGRWARVREMMAVNDLDVVLAIDSSRDEILLGHQRWLTGYIPIGGPAAALLHRDGHIELISDRIGKPVRDHYKTHGLPIEAVDGFSASRVVERIARLAPVRLGIAEPFAFPYSFASALGDLPSAPALVDVSEEFQRLRLRKSAFELDLIRKSCAIADTVWEHGAEIFKIGRTNFEIVADIDHLARLEGAESGFHIVFRLPFLGRAMKSIGNDDRIEANARYLMEVSPRYQGYYSQLTIPVTTYVDDEVALRAYENLVESKERALPDMRPGADLSQIAKSIGDFLTGRGYPMASPSLGHFCGMALEEPRHDPSSPFILEEDMTLIFHPVLGDPPELRSLLRADTYIITADGAERLNRYQGGLLTIS